MVQPCTLKKTKKYGFNRFEIQVFPFLYYCTHLEQARLVTLSKVMPQLPGQAGVDRTAAWDWILSNIRARRAQSQEAGAPSPCRLDGEPFTSLLPGKERALLCLGK